MSRETNNFITQLGGELTPDQIRIGGEPTAEPLPHGELQIPEIKKRGQKKLDDIYAQYLGYFDVKNDQEREDTYDETHDQEGNLIGSNLKYAVELSGIVGSEHTKNKLEGLKEQMRAYFDRTMKKIGVEPTRYGKSDSWIYWDIAKQSHLYKQEKQQREKWEKLEKREEEQDKQHKRKKKQEKQKRPIAKLHPDYDLQDPLEGNPGNNQVLQEIRVVQEMVDRHIAWECRRKPTVILDKIDTHNPADARIYDLLTQPGDEQDISSSKLSELGRLIREHFAVGNMQVDVLKIKRHRPAHHHGHDTSGAHGREAGAHHKATGTHAKEKMPPKFSIPPDLRVDSAEIVTKIMEEKTDEEERADEEYRKGKQWIIRNRRKIDSLKNDIAKLKELAKQNAGDESVVAAINRSLEEKRAELRSLTQQAEKNQAQVDELRQDNIRLYRPAKIEKIKKELLEIIKENRDKADERIEIIGALPTEVINVISDYVVRHLGAGAVVEMLLKEEADDPIAANTTQQLRRLVIQQNRGQLEQIADRYTRDEMAETISKNKQELAKALTIFVNDKNANMGIIALAIRSGDVDSGVALTIASVAMTDAGGKNRLGRTPTAMADGRWDPRATALDLMLGKHAKKRSQRGPTNERAPIGGDVNHTLSVKKITEESELYDNEWEELSAMKSRAQRLEQEAREFLQGAAENLKNTANFAMEANLREKRKGVDRILEEKNQAAESARRLAAETQQYADTITTASDLGAPEVQTAIQALAKMPEKIEQVKKAEKTAQKKLEVETAFCSSPKTTLKAVEAVTVVAIGKMEKIANVTAGQCLDNQDDITRKPKKVKQKMYGRVDAQLNHAASRLMGWSREKRQTNDPLTYMEWRVRRSHIKNTFIQSHDSDGLREQLTKFHNQVVADTPKIDLGGLDTQLATAKQEVVKKEEQTAEESRKKAGEFLQNAQAVLRQSAETATDVSLRTLYENQFSPIFTEIQTVSGKIDDLLPVARKHAETIQQSADLESAEVGEAVLEAKKTTDTINDLKKEEEKLRNRILTLANSLLGEQAANDLIVPVIDSAIAETEAAANEIVSQCLKQRDRVKNYPPDKDNKKTYARIGQELETAAAGLAGWSSNLKGSEKAKKKIVKSFVKSEQANGLREKIATAKKQIEDFVQPSSLVGEAADAAKNALTQKIEEIRQQLTVIEQEIAEIEERGEEPSDATGAEDAERQEETQLVTRVVETKTAGLRKTADKLTQQITAGEQLLQTL